MKTFKSTTQHTASVPMTVTKAADTLAAICNRDDTIPVVGDRTRGKTSPGYFITISHNAMSYIIGPSLAENFYAALVHPAYKEYFEKIDARLREMGITLAHSKDYWFLHKLPRFEAEQAELYVYSYQSLLDQAPAGYTAN